MEQHFELVGVVKSVVANAPKYSVDSPFVRHVGGLGAGCKEVQLALQLVKLRLRFYLWLSLVLLQSAQLTNRSLALFVIGICEYSLGFNQPRNNVIGQSTRRDVINNCSACGRRSMD